MTPFAAFSSGKAALEPGRLAHGLRNSLAGAAALAAALTFGAPHAFAAQTVHAVIIGIDDYKHVPALRGAVADARDVEKSLRELGARDIQIMVDADARRSRVLQALERVSSSVAKDDVVYIALAGHGAREPERVKGARPDGYGEVFLLQPFDPRDAAGAGEKILGEEFNHYIKRIEAAGARAVFVADTCYGGGLARSIDPRGDDLIYRSVSYTPIEDKLKPVADASDSFASLADFKQSLFLAAVDKYTRAPELKIPGIGYRGGLSYALARALEGAADVNHDGKITSDELFEYVRQTVHQLSDQRQKVVLVAPAASDPKTFVVSDVTRGISVRPAGAGASASASASSGESAGAGAGGLTIVPADDTPSAAGSSSGANAGSGALSVKPSTGGQPSQTGSGKSAPKIATGPIRIASLDGQSSWFPDLQRQQPVVLVDAKANPDLTWDPRTRDVLAGPDVIARNISAADLPGVVDQALVLGWLKQRAMQGSQPIKLLPSDEVHSKGTRIEVDVEQLTNRFLVLFNISGTGAVQLLYPLGSDAPQRLDPAYSVAFQVREPFGADHIVAVTASRPLTDLERILRQGSRRLSPERLASALEGVDARIGYVGLFTSP